MSNTFHIDSTPLQGYLKEIAHISGKSYSEVTQLTAQQVSAQASKLTKKSTKKKIKANFESKEFVTLYGNRYYLKNRYPNDLWAEIVNHREKSLDYKLQNVGIAKRSFYELAKEVPGTLTAPFPASVIRAGHPSIDQAANVQVRTFGNPASDRYTVLLRNASPVARSYGARGVFAMRRAVRNRGRAFARDLTKGVFKDLNLRAKRYPGIFVTPSTV